MGKDNVMKKICTVGSATQDIFLLYEGADTMHLLLDGHERSFMFFEQGTKIYVPSLHYATGGGATNIGVGLKRLGHQVEAVYKRGNDTAGIFIQEELTKEHLNIEESIIDPKAATAISYIIPSKEHNHVVLCYKGAFSSLTIEEFPYSALDRCDSLLIAPLSGHARLLLPSLIKKARENGLTIAHNPGNSQFMYDTNLFLSSLPAIDILLVNAYEAAHLMKVMLNECAQPSKKKNGVRSDQPELLTYLTQLNGAQYTLNHYLTELFKHGTSIAVVTNGAEGVYVATRDMIYFHPSIPTTVVSGLGAGDAFSSAFVGALWLDKSIEEALLFGVLNASSVIQHTDAKKGLLPLPELEKRAHVLGQSGIRRFPRI